MAEEKEKNSSSYIKLDYTLQSPIERAEFVNELIKNSTDKSKFTEKYMEILADYIVFAMDKNEKKEKKILTDNRMITVNKRETSYQGLVSKFENGEDGVFNLITEDKNVLLTPKISITQKDIDEIPALKMLKETIEVIEKAEKAAVGKKKYLLKKQLIEMYQEQYSIKNDFRQPIRASGYVKTFVKADLTDHFYIDDNGEPQNKGLISFFNPTHISALLCNYSNLKQEAWGDFTHDAYYMMEDLDRLIERTLKDNYPFYYMLLIYKIDGKQNSEIQELLATEFGIEHTPEYLSSLWRKKIPKLLAEQAKKDYLVWHYTNVEYGIWKQCSRCGEIKLAHNKFFSLNRTSKDGFYSICKDCRNKKNKTKE